MTLQPAPLHDANNGLYRLPRWVSRTPPKTLETVAFQSGAALTVLDALLSDPAAGVPVKLLANRLALNAATATSKLEGRLAQEADIRDAYHLTPAGDARGPDGDLLALWRAAAKLPLHGKDWTAGLAGLIGPAFSDAAAEWIEAGTELASTHGPLAGAAHVMRSVLMVDDRSERVACLLTDIALARGLGWKTPLPVSARRLSKAMLRALLDGETLTVQASLLAAIEETVPIARDLAARAAALRAVAPKLRAKGSDAALDLFLSEDAVAPSVALSPMIQGTRFRMTGRAARRFCDRLVELGVAQELTGRATFRLYGIAP